MSTPGSYSAGQRNSTSGSDHVSDHVWHPTRCAIYIRDGKRCLACGSRRRLSVDHVIARSAGGRSVPSNLVTLCTGCNCSRYDRTVEAWRPELVAVFAAAVARPIDREAGRRMSERLRPGRVAGQRAPWARGPVAVAGVPF